MEKLNFFILFTILKFISLQITEVSANDCELNYHNYLSFIKKQEYSVILFFTPYHKSFRNLGFTLNDIKLSEKVPLCKINIHENKEFASEYNLESSPSIFIFYRSRKYYIKYKNSLEIDNIITWIEENVENYITRLSNSEEIVPLLKDNNYTVIFYGQTKHYDREFRIYKAVGRRFNRSEIKFYYCEFCKQFNIFDIVVFDQINQIKSSLNKSFFKLIFNYDNFFRFIDTSTKPLVRNLSNEFTDDLFQSKNPGLIVYYDNDLIRINNGTESLQILKKIAYRNRGKLFVGIGHLKQAIVVNMAIDIGILRLINSVNVSIFIHDTSELIPKIYFLNNTIINLETLNEFVENWLNNTNKYRYYRSQDIPEKTSKDNKQILVGKNLLEVLSNTEKVSIVMFYDPFCSHCRQYHHSFDLVSEKYERYFNFYRINAKKNDVKNVKINKIPLILIWRGKNSKPIQYKKDLDFSNFTKFLEKKFKLNKEEL